MAGFSREIIQREIDMAMEYISMGCNKIYTDEDISYKNSDSKIDGLNYIQKGADILNMISKVSNFEKKPDKFPCDLKEVILLIENNTIDEWVEKYPFLKDYTSRFTNISFNFLDEIGLDESEKIIGTSNEYELFIKYNNDLKFNQIRALVKNDNEYAFSRIGIDTVLSGNSLNIKKHFENRYKKLFGKDASLDPKITETLALNYYKEITNLSKYYYVPSKGYAVCKRCGSLMKLRNKDKDSLVCSFNLCKLKSILLNEKPSEGGYINNPTKQLRYEILRFIAFPSIEEYNMYDYLKKNYEKKGIISELVLYKNKDACDISFVFNNKRYALDLKEWQDPLSLAKRISEENFKRNNKDAYCFIVIPDYLSKKSNGRKSDYMSNLEGSLQGNNISKSDIFTVSEFYKKLKTLTKENKKNETNLHA